MTPSSLFLLCLKNKSLIIAIVAVIVAVAAAAFSWQERGAQAGVSANLKFLTMAAAMALLLRLIGHQDAQEEGRFSIAAPQTHQDAEATGLTEID
jgi:hypothetical protein